MPHSSCQNLSPQSRLELMFRYSFVRRIRAGSPLPNQRRLGEK